MTYDKDELKRSRMSDAVTVTPEQATAFLEAPYNDQVDGRVADDMATTIAALRWEYAVQVEYTPGTWLRTGSPWQPSKEGAEEEMTNPNVVPIEWNARLVRRVVGEVEVVEE